MEKNFNDEYKKALELNNPTFEIPADMRSAMINALMFASPMSLGLTGSGMKTIYDKLSVQEPLNYYEHACASNNLESVTATQLNLPLEDYLKLMVAVEGLTVLWNNETNDIRQTVIQSLAATKMRKV